jgi:hypothetical protein
MQDMEVLLREMSKHSLRMKKEEAKQAKSAANAEEERVAMALIDWHAFTVMETITLATEEEEYLPPPQKSIDDINK